MSRGERAQANARVDIRNPLYIAQTINFGWRVELENVEWNRAVGLSKLLFNIGHIDRGVVTLIRFCE